MTTGAYAAKTALINRLTAYAATGQPLAGVQVAYAFPGAAVDLECIYGGGITFTQKDAVAEHPGILVNEEARISLYIRVCQRPASSVSATDIRAAAIAAQIGVLLRAEPNLAGVGVALGIAQGASDYSQTDDETITYLSYLVSVSSNFSYGTP